MKRSILAIALLLCGVNSYAALPVCAPNCDSHWDACLKTCASGEEDSWKCKTTCAAQHESCLSACNSGVSDGRFDSQGQILPTNKSSGTALKQPATPAR